MDKRFMGVLIVIALVLGGVFFFSHNNKAAPATSANILTNHIEGSSPKGIRLIEYGDYECPACAAYFNAVQQVAAKYSTTVVFQFRNFPLYQIHPNAIAGARAAEAADMQGKFWQMHDFLYTESIQNINASQTGKTYNDWSVASDPISYFKAYASSLGLNVTKFITAYNSAEVNNRVQADLKYGQSLGVNSTPTFFLDGKLISNPSQTLTAFSKVLDAEITKQGGTPPAASSSSTDTPAPPATPSTVSGQ